MSAQLIIDGRVIALDEFYAQLALDKLELASPGDVLVAVSFDGNVLVRWIDAVESTKIAPIIRHLDHKKRSQGIKPTKKLCPWFMNAVEVEFDHVASEHGSTIQALHATTRDEMIAHGKRPESYRRWLSKLKKQWVRAVVSNGKRVDDLGTLASVE